MMEKQKKISTCISLNIDDKEFLEYHGLSPTKILREVIKELREVDKNAQKTSE